MNKPFIHINELQDQTRQHGQGFKAQIAPIAPLIGATKLGYNLNVIPAGKRAYPYHAHLVNEEIFFILEGEGTLQHSGQTWQIRQGDIICCPVGKDHAHEILNTGMVDLNFLAVNTMQESEIGTYPYNKFGVFAGKTPWHKPKDYDLRIIGSLGTNLYYYEGEK